jgi:PhnB protein
MSKPKPIPDGYHTITPYLIVNDGAAALDFYKKAFSATEHVRMEMPGGKVGHAEIRIGGSVVMLAGEQPAMGARSPQTIGGTPVSILIYTEDVDALTAQATAAGATLTKPVENQFYGDRMGTVTDPFGHIWHIATHVEDVPEDELQRRAAAMHQGCAG